MFTKYSVFRLFVALFIVLMISGAASASPLLAPNGTGFTYQGKLIDGGSPANGSYDLQFKLFDALSSGSQVGSTITQTGVTVTNGLFTVQLDFGAVFTGTALYLEIGVRPDGSSGSYTTLTPRQALSPTPYALYSTQAGNTTQLNNQPASYYQNASNINIGTLGTNYFSAYADLVAESKIGTGSGQVAAGDHNHDNRYLIKTGADSMAGILTVPGIIYSPAVTDVISVPGEAFVSQDNQPFYNGGGTGGAYQSSPVTGCLVAAVHLPNNAVVTQFKGFYYNNSSSNNLTIKLIRLSMAGGFYSILASFNTTGTPGYGSTNVTNIYNSIIDNTLYGYSVDACDYYPKWDGAGNLRVMGASITYTISQAH
jgi:hypothetical protein